MNLMKENGERNLFKIKCIKTVIEPFSTAFFAFLFYENWLVGDDPSWRNSARI